jgi:hypothetical protein
MQPAQNRRRFDAVSFGRQLVSMAAGRNAGLGWFRNARAQRRVGPSAIVMDHEFGKDTAQMALVERNQKIQALAPNGSHQAFTECIRSGRSDWRP